MSKITDIITALRTGIPLLSRFADKTELPNSIDIERNSYHLLDSAWGVRIDSSSESAIQINNVLGEARNFSIVITKNSTHKESDITSFMNDQASLMEDHAELINWLLGPCQLNIGGSIAKVDYVSNSGIELVSDRNKRYIFTTTTVSIDILEDTGC